MKMNPKNFRRIMTFFMAAVMLLGCSCWTWAAETPRTIRVGFSPSPGISEFDQYGNRTGLLVDYLNEIAKYTNWEYEYIDVPPQDLTTRFLNGDFDLMGGVYYEPEYETFFAYPDYSMRGSQAALLCQEDDSRIKSYEINSLNGKTIGAAQEAEEKLRRLKIFLDLNNLDCDIRLYDSADRDENGTLYEYLYNGEIDLLLANETEYPEGTRVAATFDAQPYYIVTRPENTALLQELNTALERILDAEPNFAAEHYEPSQLPNSTLPLTAEERAYIQEKGTVTIAISQNWHPLCCLETERTHHTGILPQVLSRLERTTGLKFKILPTESQSEAIKMVQNGEADLLGAYLGSEEEAAEQGFALTKKYITINNIIVKNKNIPYPSEGLTGAILSWREMPDNVKAEHILYFDTAKEALQAVNRGEADFLYGMITTFEREMQRHFYANLVPVGSISNPTPISLAMNKPISPELLTILNKAIGSITEAEQTALLEQNSISSGRETMSPLELIYANPLVCLLFFGLLLLLVTGIFLLSVWSKMRESIMKNKLNRAEARNRAKSEFLSSMSHEIRTPMNAIVGLTDLTIMQEGLPKKAEENLQKIRTSSEYLLSLINDILDMSRIESGKLELVSEPFSLSDLLGRLTEITEPQMKQKEISFERCCQIHHDRLQGDEIRLQQVLLNFLSNAQKFTAPGGMVYLTVREMTEEKDRASFYFAVEDTGIGIAPELQAQIFDAFEQAGCSSSRSAGTGLGLPISRSIVEAMGGQLELKSCVDKGSLFSFTISLPFAPEDETEETEIIYTEDHLRGLRILLAEDNDLNAEIAQELLSSKGIDTVRAVNGLEALKLFQESPPGTFGAVLMDLRMPIMGGLEATRSIRASNRPDATLPIIAMTADSFQEDEAAAKEAGMTAFVTKPVDTAYLFRVLSEKL